MGIGIGLGIGIGRSRGGGVPFKSDALFILDGSISGDTFLDTSGNDRHFTITGKDFATDWTKGFPYKSAATISAPVGDATLIAADINNFLYDSGGDPNAIPVVSLFQDIDYEHKIFTKHQAQVLGVITGVEIIEPSVQQIVMYDTVKSDADLVKCQSYFETPTEISTAFIVPDVRDNINQALFYMTDGDKLLLKTLSLTETRPYIYENKDVYTIGGYNSQWAGASTEALLINANNRIFKGVVFDMLNGVNLGFRINGTDIELERVLLKNLTTGNTFIKELGNNASIKNSVFKGSSTHTRFCDEANGAVFDTCFIDGGFTAGMFGALADNDDSLVIKNSKINTYANTKITNTPANNVTFLGNKINITGYNDEIFNLTTSGSLLNVKHNEIYFIDSADNSGYLLLNVPASTEINIEDNTINSSNDKGSLIALASINEFNYLRNISKLYSSKISIVEIVTSALIKGNTIASNGNYILGDLSGIVISEATGEHSADIEISENKILSPRYFDSELSGGHECIYTRNYIDFTIKHNYLSGAGEFNIVIKSTTNNTGTDIPVMYNISLLSGVLVKGVSNIKYYNNTIINADITGVSFIQGDDGSDYAKSYFKNNIVVNNVDNGLLVDVQNEATGGDNEIDYNIYYSTYATPFKYEGVEKTFIEWQALGFDTNSIFLTETQFNNLFTDFDNGDFSLANGSAAIGAGETLDADYDDGLDASTDWGSDTEVPSVVTKQQTTPWDIGAYVS